MTITEHKTLVEDENGVKHNASMYVMGWSKNAKTEDNEIEKFLYRMNIWLYSVILKLVPCIVLTVITGFLIRALYKAGERSARLKNGNMYRRPSAPPGANNQLAVERGGDQQQHQGGSIKLANGGGSNKTVTSKRKRSTDRTTRLLIAILVLFLLCEFPQVSANHQLYSRIMS